MAGFDHSILTDIGWDTLADALAGGKLAFVMMEAGDGTVTGDTEMEGMTQLKHWIMDFPLVSWSDDGKGQVTLIGNLSSKNVTTGFYFRELGVRATIDNGPEILYTVANAFDQADFIPDSTGAVIIENVEIVIKIDRTVNFSVVVNAGTDVTAQNIGPDTVGPGLFRDKIGSILYYKRLTSPTNTLLLQDKGDTTSLDVIIASLVPTGVMWEYGGASLPAGGWLWCDGSVVSRAAYPGLFSTIGVRFGAGDGVNTFGLPDFRGRVAIGAGQGPGLGNRPLAGIGGEENTALTTSQMPTHGHSVNLPNHTHGVNDYGHAHSLYDPSHAHSVYDPTHAHSVADPAHHHGMWPGYQMDLTEVIGNGNNCHLAGFGNRAWTNQILPPPDTAAAGVGVGIYGAYTSIGIYGAGTGMSVYASGANISIQAGGGGIFNSSNIGGGQPHNTMQPYLAVNKIIKT
jgi:microcystin-dependent protein